MTIDYCDTQNIYKFVTKKQRDICQGHPIGAAILVAIMGPPTYALSSCRTL